MRCLAALILLAFGLPLSAETVRVQTGEHAAFTRVVLLVDPAAAWSAGRTAEGYGVVVDGAEDFDLSSFYRLIPKDRIADVRVDPARSALLLTTACDCRLDAFVDRPGVLVLDITDGPDPDSPFEVALFDAAPEVMRPSLDLDLIPRPIVALPAPRAIDPLDPARLAERQQERARVGELEARMAESLARATSQGLLTLRDAPVAEEEGTTPPSVPTTTPEPETEPGRPGLIARTSVDAGLGELFAGRDLASEILNCWPDALVDVQAWGTDESYEDQMARARTALTGEFDNVDEAALLTLARLHLFFGFGREAAQILASDGAMTRDRMAAGALADVIDGDPLTVPALTEQALCPGAVALWAVLARATDTQHPQTDARAVALTFRQLPLPLQAHLAPRLAQRLTALGEPDLAESLLTPALDGLASNADATLAISDISRATGELDRAGDALATLTNTDANAGPEALLALLTLMLDQGQPIPAETVALAEASLFEHRGDPVAPDLAAAIVSAETAAGNFSAALDDLAASEGLIAAEVAATLRNAVYAGASDRATDTGFLDLVYSTPLDGLEPAVENSLAARLLALGFAERAYDLLRGPAIGEPMGERRYLRASTAMALGRPAEAEAHLAGITTERANRILQIGPTGQPIAAMDAAAPAEDDAEEAWRVGDWAGLARSSDPLLQDVSTRLLGGGAVRPDPEAPLATGRELVSQAAATREALDALLNRFDSPDATEP